MKFNFLGFSWPIVTINTTEIRSIKLIRLLEGSNKGNSFIFFEINELLILLLWVKSQ
jgi:hypothetical protein